MKLFIQTLVLIISCLHVNGQDMRVFKFSPKLGNYVQENDLIQIEGPQNMEPDRGFTICMRVLYKFWNYNCVMISDTITFVVYGYKSGDAAFNVGNVWSFFLWPEQMLQMVTEWHSVCIIYDPIIYTANITINGRNAFGVVHKEGFFKRNFSLGNVITLGHCERVSLTGQITDLIVWKRPLTQKEIDEYSFGCLVHSASHFSSSEDMTLAWPNVKVVNTGINAREIKADRLELCTSGIKNKVKVFPIKLMHSTAFDLCQQLGGELPIPESLSDIFNTYVPNGKSIVPDICFEKFWLPIVRSKQDIFQWLNKKTHRPVPFLNWKAGEPNGHIHSEDCVDMFGNANWTYNDEHCMMSFCFACKFDKEVYFNIRGLCPDQNMIDIEYRFIQDLIKFGEYSFQGLTGLTNIVYNSTTKIWEFMLLKAQEDEEKVIGFYNGTKSFPIGRHTWFMYAQCKDIKKDVAPIIIKLSKCWNEFGCNEGSCIPLDERCNEVVDCPDNSDESQCILVQVDDDLYRKEYPPIQSNGKTTEVTVDMIVESIGSFAELSMTYKARFEIKLKWYDSRLTFTNLRNDIDKGNNVATKERGLIWIPALVFSNSLSDAYVENDALSTLNVRKEKNPTNISVSNIEENQLYDGSLNPFIYRRTYELTLYCLFELRSYPFDVQECYINVDVPHDLEGYISLISNDLEYTGTKKLTQFEVKNYTVRSDNNGNKLSVKLILQRMYLYHLTNTYLPTSSLLIIVEVTLFVDECHFETTTMVSLTAMLVMYTLYQNISDKTPQTAYLKFIDVWLIFCLVVPFVTFICQITLELQRSKMFKKLEMDKKVAWTGVDYKMYRPEGGLLKRTMQTTVVSFTLIFTFGYWIIAITWFMFK